MKWCSGSTWCQPSWLVFPGAGSGMHKTQTKIPASLPVLCVLYKLNSDCWEWGKGINVSSKKHQRKKYVTVPMFALEGSFGTCARLSASLGRPLWDVLTWPSDSPPGQTQLQVHKLLYQRNLSNIQFLTR